jgi:flagellar biosynthesis protein FlhA
LFGHEEAGAAAQDARQDRAEARRRTRAESAAARVVVRVMQGLLAERVPIRNVRAIVEALAEAGPRSTDPQILIGQVRVALGRQIVQDIVGLADELPVITLEPELERLLSNGLANSAAGPVWSRGWQSVCNVDCQRPRSVKNVAANRRCC